MRITTYEKGGNLLNPFIKLFVFLIILSLFVVPVSAISDNFNDQEIISDWTIDSGSWLFSNSSSIEGSDDYYVYTVHATTSWGGTSNIEYEIYRSQSSDNKYYEIDIKTTGTQYPGMYAKSIFVFESNGVDENSIYIGSSTTSFGLYSDTFTISTISLSQNTWYHVEIITLGTNVQIDVYDMDDNLIGRRAATYTPISDSNQLSLKSNLIDGHVDMESDLTSYFDNLYTSITVDTGAASGVLWESASYTEGDTGKYTWNIDSDAWYSFLYKHKIIIEKDGTEIYSTTVGKSGDRYYDFDTAGTYTVKLLSSKIIFTNWVTVASDNTHAYYRVDSFINIPQIAEQKTNFTVNYLYGITPPTAAIFIKKLNEELEEYILYDIIYLDGGASNTDYSQNISIWGEGFYKLILYNANVPEHDLKTDVIQIIKVIIPPQTRINTSRIRSQLDTYSVSDMVWGDYAIDFINYTSYVINLELYNYEYDAVVYSKTVNDQCGVILIPLYTSDLTIFTGEHNVRLSSYSNTGVFVDDIVHDNFTINLVNPNGYGLTLSKYEVYSDEIFVIKCIVPQLSTIRIINRLTLEEIDNFDINSSSYINYKISKIGDYEIRLISNSGYVEGNQYIKVVEGTIVDDPLIDEGEVIPDTTFQDNTTSLLNSPYLIGLFIMCVFLAIGATNGIGGTIVTGSIGLGIVCYMGIFPWILLVIEVLVVAVLMGKGIINLSGD